MSSPTDSTAEPHSFSFSMTVLSEGQVSFYFCTIFAKSFATRKLATVQRTCRWVGRWTVRRPGFAQAEWTGQGQYGKGPHCTLSALVASLFAGEQGVMVGSRACRRGREGTSDMFFGSFFFTGVLRLPTSFRGLRRTEAAARFVRSIVLPERPSDIVTCRHFLGAVSYAACVRGTDPWRARQRIASSAP